MMERKTSVALESPAPATIGFNGAAPMMERKTLRRGDAASRWRFNGAAPMMERKTATASVSATMARASMGPLR